MVSIAKRKGNTVTFRSKKKGTAQNVEIRLSGESITTPIRNILHGAVPDMIEKKEDCSMQFIRNDAVEAAFMSKVKDLLRISMI